MKQRKVLSLAGGGGSSSTANSNVTGSHSTQYGTGSAGAFTMAEILLSLTIIGVVAAITLPSLTGNINERTWNTQRKALYARFSQAIALMPSLNGYGTLKEASSAGASDAVDTAAETFITDGLAKVLKINNICDSEHLQDCGIPEKYNDMLGNNKSVPTTMQALNPLMLYAYQEVTPQFGSHSMLNTKAAAFETVNGESIIVYYNPHCAGNTGELQAYYVQPKICANFIYDLNGNKGPNTMGKDMGIMTAFYSTDSVVVAPMPYRQIFNNVESHSASTACTTKTGAEYRIPTKDELGSLFVNKDVLGVAIGDGHMFSSTRYDQERNVVLGFAWGHYRVPVLGDPWNIWCVQR